jgi:D-alanyl-lipoteichoic acid acyltransferase DltB (MBOAT superfamily)
VSIKIKFLSVVFLPLLTACVGNMNPTGGNSSPDYPFFITTQAQIVKNIAVPIGTKLVYQEQPFKQGKQDRLMSETKLTAIEFPHDQTILWEVFLLPQSISFLTLKCMAIPFMPILNDCLTRKKIDLINFGSHVTIA